MPNYSWKGRTRGGRVQEGVLVADSKDAAIAALRKQQIIVTAVTEKGKEFALPKLGGRISSEGDRDLHPPVLGDDRRRACRWFSVWRSSVRSRTTRRSRRALIQVRQDVESGSTLADSLRKHPKAFDGLYCNMVAAGEAGGILDTILQRLSTVHREDRQAALGGAFGDGLPVAVISIAVIVVWVILWKVIPTFASLFEGLGATLPLPTRITIGLSHFIGRVVVADDRLREVGRHVHAVPLPQDAPGAGDTSIG